MKVFILVIFAATIIHSSVGKIFEKCELVRQLSSTFPRGDLADWNCLVIHESSYNSAARGPMNTDGTYDYGIFQINSGYWCKLGSPGGDCRIDCNKLLDDDITDDIVCARLIFQRHGFMAWYGWQDHCRGQPLPNVNDCFSVSKIIQFYQMIIFKTVRN